MQKVWERFPVVFIIIICLMTSYLHAATTGKIAGVVKDASTGEPLPGANVAIEGTTMGASTDVQGRYFIINVPAGPYSVKASMMGYTVVTQKDVNVSVGMTTELNFKLNTTVIEGEAVTVMAERPLIEKTLTQSKTTVGVHELDNTLPVADIHDIIETSVSSYKGYVRGGRKYETKTLVDGVDISDTYFAGGTGAYGGGDVGHTYQGFRRSEMNETSMGEVPTGAIQELDVFAGTITAEYPTASAGIVNIVTKSGGSEYHGKIFARMTPSNEWEHFGSNVYWMKDSQGDKLGYFAEGQKYANDGTVLGARKAQLYTWNEDLARDKYYYDPTDSVGLGRSYEFEGNLSGPVPFLGNKAGFFISAKYQNNRTTALPFDVDKRVISNLKLNYDINSDMRVTLYGLLDDGGKLFDFVNWKFNPKWSYYMEGAPRYKDLSHFSYAKWTHTLSPNTFYEVQLSHNSKTSWIGYPDDNGDGYSSLDEKGDFITFNTLQEYIKYVGGEMKTDTLRDTDGNITGYETYLDRGKLNGYAPGWYDDNPDVVLSATDPNRTFFYWTTDPGTVDETKANFHSMGGWYRTHYPSPLYSKTYRAATTLKADFTSQVNYNHQLKSGFQFRYHNVDVNHKQAELGGSGRLYPYNVMHVDIHHFNPKDFAVYAQDRIEYKGMIVNVGGRLDAYNADTRKFLNDFHPWDYLTDESGALTQLAPQRGDKVGWKWYFSPRIGVSHPVSDEMAMHYSFGKFIQYPDFVSLYEDYNFTNYAASPEMTTKWVDQEPMRSTSYEMGLQYSPVKDIVVDATVYYRDVENYSSTSFLVVPYKGQSLRFYTTWGHADTRGIELSVEKRPDKWWAGRLNYAYSYIKTAQNMAGNDPTQRQSYSSKADSSDYSELPFYTIDQFNYREDYVTERSSGVTNANPLAGGYDRTHRFSATVMCFLPYGIELSAVSELASGFKYRPTQNTDNDPFFDISPKIKEGPWNFFVNTRITLDPMKLMKDTGVMTADNIGGMKIRCFAEIRNLTNHENILAYNITPFQESKDQQIFELGRDLLPNTGDEDDPQGVYKLPADTMGRLLYGPARQIWAGLEFSF